MAINTDLLMGTFYDEFMVLGKVKDADVAFDTELGMQLYRYCSHALYDLERIPDDMWLLMIDGEKKMETFLMKSIHEKYL